VVTPRGPADDGPSGDVTEQVDDAVLGALAGADGVVGVWRAWRHIDRDGPAPASRAVYAVEVRDLPALTAVEEVLHGPAAPPSGPAGALVTAYVEGEVPPPPLQVVVSTGELVHVGVPEPEFRLAPAVLLGQYVHVSGPMVLSPTLREVDAIDALVYLRSARALPAGEPGVAGPPDGLRTDGTWIWSDELAGHVTRTRIGLPPHFAEYLRTRPRVPRFTGDTVVALARRWLERLRPA
jgi:hypothetical protein